ncbi:Trp biosynthesis-associated membrane protein [Nocardiopsis coralliicola]
MSTAASRRGYTAAVAAAALGAAALIAATGQVWAHGTVEMPGRLAAAPVEAGGADLVPAASGLGWAGLAALAAVFSTRGRARMAVGAAMALLAAGALAALWTGTRGSRVAAALADEAASGRAPSDVEVAWVWPAAAAAGAALIALAGLAVSVRGPGWPGMGSRYDRHGTAARRPAGPADPADLWKSLDGGDDPTLDPAPAAGERAETTEHPSVRPEGAPAAQKEP